MTNWQEIVNGIEAPKDLTPSQWMAMEGPKFSLYRDPALSAFIERYKITQLGSSQVALKLPAGISRIAFLEEAQELSIALHASNPEKYWADQAVHYHKLPLFALEPSFTNVSKRALSLRIDGRVEGSINQTFDEQKANGWNDVAREDLALAHTAFYLLTGENLFKEGCVRVAAGGPFYFDSDGLTHLPGDFGGASPSYSASRFLRPPKFRI